MADFQSYSDAIANGAFFDPLSRVSQINFVKPDYVDVDQLDEDDVHVITSDAKNVIFGKHLPRRNAQESRGQPILRRLASLAPASAKHFQPKKDAVENMTFRLWAQRETPESREDAYIALSYCWPPAKRRDNSRYPLPISSLMFAVLAAERQWRSTGIWIDQVCIDQDNQDEKAVSVGAMDLVYQCAQTVVVALLDVQVHLAQQDFLRRYIREYETAEVGTSPHINEKPPFFVKHPVFRRLLEEILSSKWFTRAWCGHEMESGENLVFYVPCQPADGGRVVEMLALRTTFLWDMLMLATEVPSGAGHQGQKILIDRLVRVFDLRRRVAKAAPDIAREHAEFEDLNPSPMAYTAQIRHVFELAAGGDPALPLGSPERKTSATLDKMSIVLNTLRNNLAVVRNLQSNLTEEQGMKHMLLLALAANDPTVLCMTGSYFEAPGPPPALSWLCKPTFVDLGSGEDRRKHPRLMRQALCESIQVDSSLALEWIKMDVFALGLPQLPDHGLVSLARDLVQRGIELGMGLGPPGRIGDVCGPYVGKTDLVSRIMLMTLHSTTNEWGAGPLYQYWHDQTFLGDRRERFCWTLACLLELGKEWVLGTAGKCGYPQPFLLRKQLNDCFNGDRFLELRKSGWSDNVTHREGFNVLCSVANWMVHWGTIRVHGQHSEGFMPLIFNHGLAGKAVTFTRSDALLQVVIPCPLFEDDYSRYYRIWLLQAEDDAFYEKMTKAPHLTKWFLRGKGILFTNVEARHTVFSEGSAADGNPGWRFRRGVKVHGPPREFQRT